MEIDLIIPNKYQAAFGSLSKEENLIDNCKYILHFSDEYEYIDGSLSLPCRSKDEAIYFLRNAQPIKADNI